MDFNSYLYDLLPLQESLCHHEMFCNTVDLNMNTPRGDPYTPSMIYATIILLLITFTELTLEYGRPSDLLRISVSLCSKPLRRT